MSIDAYPSDQTRPHPLEYMFHPRSVAVVGISADPPKLWIKRLYLESFLKNRFPGQLYLVNPKGGEMEGLPLYRSLKDIPGPVDHVVMSVPAAPHSPDHGGVPGRRGQGGARLLVGLCRDGRAGPRGAAGQAGGDSTAGKHAHPRSRLPGALLSRGQDRAQPGPAHGAGPRGLPVPERRQCHLHGPARGSPGTALSKIVSYGNACDIDECDLLEYFASDPETKVIAAYIEGAHDGVRLLKVLRQAAAAKPVVVFKGGFSPDGGRAAASHTGSLAGADTVWDGLLKQVGAIRVFSIEEMVDMLVALLRVRPFTGLNVCVIGHGGGASVMATDEMSRAGFRLIPIPEQVRSGLKEFVDLANSMLRNPLDLGTGFVPDSMQMIQSMGGRPPLDVLREAAAAGGLPRAKRLNSLLGQWPGLDLVVYHHGFDISPVPLERARAAGGPGSVLLAANACELPKALVFHSMGNDASCEASIDVRGLAAELGLPLFLSMRGAAVALRKLADYGQLIQRGWLVWWSHCQKVDDSPLPKPSSEGGCCGGGTVSGVCGGKGLISTRCGGMKGYRCPVLVHSFRWASCCQAAAH